MGGWTIEDYRNMPNRMRELLHVKIATENAHSAWKASQKPKR